MLVARAGEVTAENPGRRALLFGCNEAYVRAIVSNRNRLLAESVDPYADASLIARLTNEMPGMGGPRAVGGACLHGTGNHTLIVSERDALLEGMASAFLARVGHVGLANLDVKVDPRDGSYRFFDFKVVATITPWRLGRTWCALSPATFSETTWAMAVLPRGRFGPLYPARSPVVSGR